MNAAYAVTASARYRPRMFGSKKIEVLVDRDDRADDRDHADRHQHPAQQRRRPLELAQQAEEDRERREEEPDVLHGVRDVLGIRGLERVKEQADGQDPPQAGRPEVWVGLWTLVWGLSVREDAGEHA
jgi:hypothetical protein